MGLDTTHDCWHGAYSGFMRWRIGVAKAAGVPLLLMDSFWGISPYFDNIDEIVARHGSPPVFTSKAGGGMMATRDSLLNSLSVTLAKDPDTVAMQSVLETVLEWLPLKWEQLQPDVIHVLLNHSDCDGIIEHQYCKPLADRLTELLPFLPTTKDWGHIGNWQDKTKQFIDGLMLAHNAGEDVEFH